MPQFEDLEKHYDLTPRQWRAAYLLATPGHAPFDDIAAQCGVSRKTLWTWRKQGAFYEAVKAVVRRMVGVEQHADMVEVLLKRAKRGDVQALKTYFAWQRDLAAFGVNVDLDVNVEAPPTEIIINTGPPADLQERLAAYCVKLCEREITPEYFMLKMVAVLTGSEHLEKLRSIITTKNRDILLPPGEVVEGEIVEPKPMNLAQSVRKRFMDNRPWLPENRNKR